MIATVNTTLSAQQMVECLVMDAWHLVQDSQNILMKEEIVPHAILAELTHAMRDINVYLIAESASPSSMTAHSTSVVSFS